MLRNICIVFNVIFPLLCSLKCCLVDLPFTRVVPFGFVLRTIASVPTPSSNLDRLIILGKQPTLFCNLLRHILNKKDSEARSVCPPDTERICSNLSSDIAHWMSQGQAGPPLYIL